jgi:hypothetical protein
MPTASIAAGDDEPALIDGTVMPALLSAPPAAD